MLRYQTEPSSAVQKHGIAPLLRAAQDGVRTILTVHGYEVGAVVSMEDVRRLEEMEAADNDA